jgi:hypothetical protein
MARSYSRMERLSRPSGATAKQCRNPKLAFGDRLSWISRDMIGNRARIRSKTGWYMMRASGAIATRTTVAFTQSSLAAFRPLVCRPRSLAHLDCSLYFVSSLHLVTSPLLQVGHSCPTRTPPPCCLQGHTTAVTATLIPPLTRSTHTMESIFESWVWP